MDDNKLEETPHWMMRVPRSLAAAYSGITNILIFMECGVVFTKEPERFARTIAFLMKSWREVAPQLRLVEDEFIAAANNVASWKGTCSPSWHSLVFTRVDTLCRKIQDSVMRAKFSHLPVLERFEHRHDITDEDVFAWIVKEGVSSTWKAVPPPLPLENVFSHLRQELCRAADRRLLTKRRYKGDEIPLSTQEAEEFQRLPERNLFVPSNLQQAILNALDGRSLNKESLADECRVDPRRLYKPLALKELMNLGLVDNKRGLGYYRPDSPPKNAINLTPKSHQQGTNGPK